MHHIELIGFAGLEHLFGRRFGTSTMTRKRRFPGFSRKSDIIFRDSFFADNSMLIFMIVSSFIWAYRLAEFIERTTKRSTRLHSFRCASFLNRDRRCMESLLNNSVARWVVLEGLSVSFSSTFLLFLVFSMRIFRFSLFPIWRLSAKVFPFLQFIVTGTRGCCRRFIRI